MRIATAVLLALMVMVPIATPSPASPQRDVPGEVDSARRALQGARNDLDHAGGEWGGHRVAAIRHIDAALGELGEAERWAHAHHDIK
jgi:hypothetical protein